MSALTPPAFNAPAEEWGRFALAIPGWRTPWEDLPASWLATEDGLVPNPDHWAWEGWMVRMLGPEISMTNRPDRTRSTWVDRSDGTGSAGWWVGERRLVGGWSGTGVTLGRAAISAAAALGRWPGGSDG